MAVIKIEKKIRKVLLFIKDHLIRAKTRCKFYKLYFIKYNTIFSMNTINFPLNYGTILITKLGDFRYGFK